MYKNIFISQPMSGKSEEEILAIRQKEIKEIYQIANKDDDVQVNIIDSYIDDETRNGFQGYMTNVINWDIYWLSQSLQKLAMANVLWLCDGWEYSKGCNIELECAIQYGLDIVYPPMHKNGEWVQTMGNSEFVKYCKRFVVDYVNSTEYVLPSGYVPRIFEYNVFVVWISKVLQNNKALLSTTIEGDTRYYEITYNGDKDEFYFDAYDKIINKCITRGDITRKEGME